MIASIPAYSATLLPNGFSVYGYKPDTVACQGGWVYALLGSFGDDKSTFYTRVWEWVAPFTSVRELSMPYHVYHACLAPTPSLLLLFGIASFGVGYQYLGPFTPLGGAALLGIAAVDTPLLTAEHGKAGQYQGMIDDLWTAHRRQHGWTRRQIRLPGSV